MDTKKIEQDLRDAGLRKSVHGRWPRLPNGAEQVTVQQANSSSNTPPPSETASRL